MAEKEVIATIKLKDEASAAIKRVANESASLEKTFGKLGKTLAGVFAVKKILDFTKASIAAADAQDKMIRAIGSTEKAMGRYAANTPWKSITKDITQQLDAMKEVGQEYAILDSDIEKLRLKLAGPLRGLGNDKLNEAIPKILALGGLQDFNSDEIIKEIITKASGRKLTARNAPFLMQSGIGNESQITKMSLEVMFDKLLNKADEQKEAIEENANSIGGLTRKIQNLWGRLQETAGYALMPVVKSLLEKLIKLPWTKIGEGFTKIIEFASKIFNFASENPKLAGAAGIGAGALAITSAINPAAGAIITVALASISAYALSQIFKKDTAAKVIDATKKSATDIKVEMAKTKYDENDIWAPNLNYALNSALSAGGIMYDSLVGRKKEMLKNQSFQPGEWGKTKLDPFGSGMSGMEYALKNFNESGASIFNNALQVYKDIFDVALNMPDRAPTSDEMEYLKFISGIKFKNDSETQEEIRKNKILANFVGEEKKEPIKVEISLKADMPYQASLSLTDSSGTQETKIASKVNNRRIGLRS